MVRGSRKAREQTASPALSPTTRSRFNGRFWLRAAAESTTAGSDPSSLGRVGRGHEVFERNDQRREGLARVLDQHDAAPAPNRLQKPCRSTAGSRRPNRGPGSGPHEGRGEGPIVPGSRSSAGRSSLHWRETARVHPAPGCPEGGHRFASGRACRTVRGSSTTTVWCRRRRSRSIGMTVTSMNATGGVTAGAGRAPRTNGGRASTPPCKVRSRSHSN